jgi:hypothetical protein
MSYPTYYFCTGVVCNANDKLNGVRQQCSLSYTAIKAFATAAGPTATHRDRLAGDGTYKKRHYAEVNDNPLYRM